MKILDKVKKAALALLILSGPLYSIGQQDPMYTQYIFNLQTVNPAYAGSWQTMGFMALTRHQWVGMTGHPTTQTFSFQTPFTSQNVGVGFNVVHDKLGSERRIMVNLDYSYRVMLNSNVSLRFGIKGGFTNYNNDLNSLQPYPDGVPDPALMGMVENKFMPNVGFGLFLSSQNYYLSLSLPRLIQNSFQENSGNFSKMSEARQLYFAGGMVFTISDNVKFKPTFMTKSVVGSPFQFDVSANFLLAEKFWIGAMYRSGDAFGAIAQWVINSKFRVGYAADFTFTDLKNYQHGVHEVMISYEITYLKRKYVSPRYF
ncbi:MAG: type IX secretion system membrane protein PorP/SprF [Bacteroidia bacterium]|nr:type IX secretion system membrane protein PorP/SprF [Bacteroidia bacterium]